MWSCHVVIWSCIHVIMWSCIHVFMYSCIHVFMCSCVHVVMWSCGHVVMWSCGHVVMWSCIHIFIYSYIHQTIKHYWPYTFKADLLIQFHSINSNASRFRERVGLKVIKVMKRQDDLAIHAAVDTLCALMQVWGTQVSFMVLLAERNLFYLWVKLLTTFCYTEM